MNGKHRLTENYERRELSWRRASEDGDPILIRTVVFRVNLHGGAFKLAEAEAEHEVWELV